MSSDEETAAVCQYCNSNDGYELQSDRGQKTVCLQCLAIEQAQSQTRKPFDMVTPDEYRRLQGWLTVLTRVRRGDEPIPEDNDADWRSQPAVPDSITEFVTNVTEAEA